MFSGDGVDGRSRDYVCPMCKVKNIDLLPDPQPGLSDEKPKDAPVMLSFGYQKDQSSTPGNGTPTTGTVSFRCG